MGRSIKKGPFVDGHLLDKIAKLNSANQKKPSLYDTVAEGRIVPPAIGQLKVTLPVAV